MDYRKMTSDELEKLKIEAMRRGNYNAAGEVEEFIELYNKTVTVVKGRKVPKGTTGLCFWIRRYDNSKHGDPWGIYSNTRIGIKTSDGETYFTSADNVEVVSETVKESVQ